MLGYYIGAFVPIHDHFKPSREIGMTMAYLVIGWSSVVNIFNVRSFNQSIFTIGFTSNRLLFAGICFSFVALGLTAVVPGLMDVFYCVPVSLQHWLIMIGFSLAPLAAGEIHKILVRRKQALA